MKIYCDGDGCKGHKSEIVEQSGTIEIIFTNCRRQKIDLAFDFEKLFSKLYNIEIRNKNNFFILGFGEK